MNAIQGVTEIEQKCVKAGKNKIEEFNFGLNKNWECIFGKNKFRGSWLFPYINEFHEISLNSDEIGIV